MSLYRPSYIEGRLRLAENRERQRGKGAAPTSSAPPDGVPTPEERAAAEKAAEANMARLLQEEDAAKVNVLPSASIKSTEKSLGWRFVTEASVPINRLLFRLTIHMPITDDIPSWNNMQIVTVLFHQCCMHSSWLLSDAEFCFFSSASASGWNVCGPHLQVSHMQSSLHPQPAMTCIHAKVCDQKMTFK